jgi:biotin carboxyl carrier protein
MKIRVQINSQNYVVEVGDLQDRPITAIVDGEVFEVWPDEGRAALAPAPVLDAPAPKAASAPALPASPAAPAAAPAPRPAVAPLSNGGDKSKQVVAPIPGTILTVSVKEGQEVAFGQELCTLEAMKMKSAIRANRAGKIAAIRVAAGDKVSQNQTLMDYAD